MDGEKRVKVLSETCLAYITLQCMAIKGTIRRVRVILNHQLVKSRFNSQPHGSE